MEQTKESQALIPVSYHAKENDKPLAEATLEPLGDKLKEKVSHGAKFMYAKIDNLRKNILRLEKDLNTMGNGVARLRKKAKLYSGQ